MYQNLISEFDTFIKLERIVQDNKKKIYQPIIKIIDLQINSFQVSIYFSMHMIKLVFFRYGVITLHQKQEQELKRIFEG